MGIRVRRVQSAAERNRRRGSELVLLADQAKHEELRFARTATSHKRLCLLACAGWLWVALVAACGSESVCPEGTTGDRCVPAGSVGEMPEVPVSRPDVVGTDGFSDEDSTSDDVHDATDSVDSQQEQPQSPATADTTEGQGPEPTDAAGNDGTQDVTPSVDSETGEDGASLEPDTDDQTRLRLRRHLPS